MLYNDEKNDLLGQTGCSAVKGACHQVTQTEMNARSKQRKKRTDSSTLSSNPPLLCSSPVHRHTQTHLTPQHKQIYNWRGSEHHCKNKSN